MHGPEHVFSHEEWKRLPLELRQRWWRETDYGEELEKASPELLDQIRRVLRGEP